MDSGTYLLVANLCRLYISNSLRDKLSEAYLTNLTMTHPEKIKYMEIAANLCRLHFTNEQLDILVSLYELVVEKKGNTDMMDVATVEAKVKSRAIQADKSIKKKR